MTGNTPVLSGAALRSQAVFRVVLDSMARPGKVNSLPTMESDGPYGGILAVLESLVDHEVTYWVSAALEEVIVPALETRTRGRKSSTWKADFVVADGDGAFQAIVSANAGTIEYPDKGATIVIMCQSLSEGPVRLCLEGPGVDGSRALSVASVPWDAFQALMERNQDFPLGLDTVLVSTDGAIACIPRSSRISQAVPTFPLREGKGRGEV